jgi:uncharacterized membrane protein
MTGSEDALARLEVHLGRLLVVGVTLSASCLAVGVVLWLVTPGSRGAARLLQAGLFILMATPILRVVVSIAEYIRMRDWFFVVTTLAVLAVLATTVFYALTAS